MSDPVRVVFLDFDGVFTMTFERIVTKRQVSQRAIALLDAAFQKLGIKIVVSSTWRLGESSLTLGAYLDLAGFLTNTYHPEPATGRSPKGFRGDEVRDWLSRHPEVTEWAIIDDDLDFYPEQLKRMVHTDYVEGFTVRNYLQLLQLFGSPVDAALLKPFREKGGNNAVSD